jgi:DNA invertase Pin-like site-specific DNA recombinase
MRDQRSCPEPKRLSTAEQDKRTRHTVLVVIVHKVDRFARNRRDDANMLFEIMESGAELVSATESIDGTPSGRLTHGILASIAEYYSLNLSAEVKKGLHGKARLGGTPGYVRIGYLNVGEMVDGREIRAVAIDPDRGPHITWAFTAFASVPSRSTRCSAH